MILLYLYGKRREKIKKKDSFFDKVKKPLYMSLLTGGLMVNPSQKAESVPFPGQGTYYDATGFIGYSDCYFYRLKWEIDEKYKDVASFFKEYPATTKSSSDFDLFSTIFEEKYKETKDQLALFLQGYFLHEFARSSSSIEETEEKLLQVLKIAEEGLSLNPKSAAFANMYGAELFNLSFLYRELYTGNEAYIERGVRPKEPTKKQLEGWREKSIKYAKECIEFYDKILKKYKFYHELDEDIYLDSKWEFENTRMSRVDLLKKYILKDLGVEAEENKNKDESTKK